MIVLEAKSQQGENHAGFEQQQKVFFTSVSLGLQGQITRRSAVGEGSGGIEGYFLLSASSTHRKYCLETECFSAEGRTSCEPGRWRSMSQGVLGVLQQHPLALPTALQAILTLPGVQCQQRNFVGVPNNWERLSFVQLLRCVYLKLAYTSKLLSCMCKLLI